MVKASYVNSTHYKIATCILKRREYKPNKLVYSTFPLFEIT